MLIGRSDIVAELHFLEPVCPKFLNGLSTESRSILLHIDRVLREVRGNGNRIVFVERIGMFFYDREKLLAAVTKSFFGPMRVSVMLDSNGSNTTAVAAVAKLRQAAGGNLQGKRALVTAGTGPVGTGPATTGSAHTAPAITAQ